MHCSPLAIARAFIPHLGHNIDLFLFTVGQYRPALPCFDTPLALNNLECSCHCYVSTTQLFLEVPKTENLFGVFLTSQSCDYFPMVMLYKQLWETLIKFLNLKRIIYT